MRANLCSTPVAEPVPDSAQARIDETIRILVALIDGAHAPGTEGNATDNSEEVLVSAEVDGRRYQILRMPDSAREHVQLSPREREIVRMVAKGHPNKLIADVLSISIWTVCTHLRRIFAKLGVGSRAAMIAQLSELGMLPGEHQVPSRPAAVTARAPVERQAPIAPSGPKRNAARF
jgi:DNA-binding CsgD family transcriptional regulator